MKHFFLNWVFIMQLCYAYFSIPLTNILFHLLTLDYFRAMKEMVIYSKVQLVLDFDTLYPGNALSMFCYYNDYHGNVYNNNILPICQVDKISLELILASCTNIKKKQSISTL